jgi:hypothetical protein
VFRTPAAQGALHKPPSNAAQEVLGALFYLKMSHLNYSSDTLSQLLSIQNQRITALAKENEELKIKLKSYEGNQQPSITHKRKASE